MIISKLKGIGLLIFCILNFQSAFSQENYIAGYVVKNNSDTIKGFVDYRDWRMNPDLIKFKTTLESEPISYSPMDISEFVVDNEIYVSGIVDVETSPVQSDKLMEDPNLKLKVDTTFLQTLFEGDKSLYFYKNSDGKENLYIEQEGKLELLVYKKYLSRKDGTFAISENKRFLGQLTLYLSDCPTINSKLENTSYQQKSLTKLFRYYYECSESNVQFQKEVEKVNLEVGIMAGVSHTSLKFSGESHPLVVDAEYTTSINFSAGLFFNIVLPRNQNKWSVNFELLYSSYLLEGGYMDYQHEDRYLKSNSKLGFSYLKINNLLRYTYPVNNMFVFFNGGLSNGFIISETNSQIIESKFYTSDEVKTEPVLNDTRNYELGFIVGSGVKYSKFSLEGRYEIGTGMSHYQALNSTSHRIFLLLGYRF